MSVLNLERMFHPRSVAVIGASEKKGSVGTAVMNNLLDGGFKGRIYPVNPHYTRIRGMKVFSSVRKLQNPPDLVLIATPIQTVPEIIRLCVEQGAGGAVVISAGGKEIGKDGAAIEAEIRKEIAGNDFRVIGPNCLGVMSSKALLNASFASRTPEAGKMAFISQSGAICTAILDFAATVHLGFSYFISLGSMLDVDFGDLIDYLGGDPEVSSIVMYIENLTRIRGFMSAARAVSRVKPIIALKAGRTRAGAAAAASHTGAMAGEDAIYDAAFNRAGIVRVRTFAELFDCAAFLGKQPHPQGAGLAIVTNAGGPGVMAADALSDYGVEPVRLSEATRGKLDAILPPCWSRGNPADILGDASAERYRMVVDILIDAPEVNGLLVMLAPQAMTEPETVAQVLAGRLKGKAFPMFTSWLGGIDVAPGREIFNRAGIPTFDSPERAVRAFMDLYRYARNNELLQEIPEKLPRKPMFNRDLARAIIREGLARPTGILSEAESKTLLSTYGIPVNSTVVAADPDDAVEIAGRTGYPVVLKIHSTVITHKSDAGCVALDLKDADAVRRAFYDIRANAAAGPGGVFEGVTVQKMLDRPDYELIAGARRDPDFGPVILFGMGGVLTEILGDRAIALPPLNRVLARRLMEETRIYKVLRGYRNHKPLDLALFEEILIRLSQLVTDCAEIEEIDINPLIVSGHRIVAVDARVIVKPSSVNGPLHLVISPYPNEYEEEIVIDWVGKLLIRPIRPEDAPLLVELFHSLSETSIYNRFFSPLKELPPDMVARFTQIDYDREIAIVAVQQAGDKERLIGVGRVIMAHDQKSAEFAVVVADEFHGMGIGAALMQRCLAVAETRNIEKVWGMVLPRNTKMLALGRKLGFTVALCPGTQEYELTLNLRKTEPAEIRVNQTIHS